MQASHFFLLQNGQVEILCYSHLLRVGVDADVDLDSTSVDDRVLTLGELYGH